MITACRMIGDRCIIHGHEVPCPDREIMTVEEYEDKRRLGIIDIPSIGDICFICGDRVRMITCGEDSWEIRCAGCQMLYSED